MKIVILDDLNTEPPTPRQVEKLKRWFNRLDGIFPSGQIQVFQLQYQKEDLRKALGF